MQRRRLLDETRDADMTVRIPEIRLPGRAEGHLSRNRRGVSA